MFLKLFACLQTSFAVEMHLSEGQGLEEQVNMAKLRLFLVGTGRQGRHLVPLKTFIKNNHESDDARYEVTANLIFVINCHSHIPYLEKCIVAQVCKFYLHAPKFIEVGNRNREPSNKACSSLGMTKTKRSSSLRWKERICYCAN